VIHTYAPGEAEKLDAADMAKQEEAWEASGHNDLFALLWALTYCQQALPPWINHAVRELIDRRLDAGLWTQDQIDSMRWACACDEIKKRGWTGAFERVSNRLANTPRSCKHARCGRSQSDGMELQQCPEAPRP